MYKIAASSVIFAPFVAFAQALEGEDFFTKMQNFTNQAVGILLGIATLIFLVGVIQYVVAGGNEEKQKNAKGFMMYGIIGLVVMVAVWGIVNLLVNTLGLENTAATLPYTF